jgi:hypothetical protein
MKLDPELQELAEKAVKIHEDLHTNGFNGMTGDEFKDLYYSNLNNYIAFIAHAQFASGMQDAVVILKDVIPLKQATIKQLLDHNQGGLHFTKRYADDIANYKRQVHIWVSYIDGSTHQAIYGVKDIAAKQSLN